MPVVVHAVAPAASPVRRWSRPPPAAAPGLTAPAGVGARATAFALLPWSGHPVGPRQRGTV